MFFVTSLVWLWCSFETLELLPFLLHVFSCVRGRVIMTVAPIFDGRLDTPDRGSVADPILSSTKAQLIPEIIRLEHLELFR